MESLNDTEWDVIISGTGLPQSLLALALSRSGKKVLHVDRHDYYGGDEAALSLSEAEAWAKEHAGESKEPSTFSHAAITQAPPDDERGTGKLAQARAYALALAPQLLHSKSALLPALVTSKTHSQLEFQAVGSWFIVNTPPDGSASQARLTRVPGGREDVFRDATLDLKAKRALMKFLRFVVNYEEQGDTWEAYREKPFSTLLEEKFGLTPVSHPPILALTLSTSSSENTPAKFAVPRVARYLTSIGVFGPGFGAVLPKWGGLAEIGQVACRACAVGGGVYVLGKGITDVQDAGDSGTKVHLTDGETVTTNWLAGVADDLPSRSAFSEYQAMDVSTKCISIVSSPLASLFPPTSEGGVTPAGAVVVVQPPDLSDPPVHIFVHSSESGECPKDQCVLYASVAESESRGFSLLEEAVLNLLESTGEQTVPQVLWSMRYEQRHASVADPSNLSGAVINLKSLSPDLAFDDSTLKDVKAAWLRVTDADPDSFMKFEAREGTMEDEDFS